MTIDASRIPVIEVYSRPGCHLCEILIDELMPIIRDRFELQVFNIDTNSDWRLSFGQRIPVVVFEDLEICHFKLDKEAIARIVDGKTAS
jgi:hypothetical protein